MRSRYPGVLIVVCATLFASHPALAQFLQRGPKLVGTDAFGQAQQGGSVSLSADGNTAIIGGDVDDFGFDNDVVGVGAAWVWTRNGKVWTQQGMKLVGSGALGSAEQGLSVSLSADGNTAVVGGPYDNIGAAWVWTRSEGIWTQQGNKLVGSGADDIGQGQSVALSADGSTAIIGGDYLAWVWTRSNGVWIQQSTELVGSGASDDAEQGASVSLSADGTTAIVGGPYDNGDVGAAWIFVATAESVVPQRRRAVTH
jgi:hypothetical protein